MDFVLTINDAQARELALVLDIWCRIGTGELTAILGHPEIQKRLVTDEGVTTEDVRRLLIGLKRSVFGLSEISALSVLSPEVGDGTKRAFDIFQVIRRGLAIASDPQSLRAAMPVIRVANEPMPEFHEKPNDPV